ncbi:MAG: hypothetical protein C4321_02710, partial [Chloroflexota bacterium]
MRDYALFIPEYIACGAALVVIAIELFFPRLRKDVLAYLTAAGALAWFGAGLAFLDRDATRHQEVVASLASLLEERRAITHNYVLIETEALARRRLGAGVARRLLEDVVPVLEIVWVDRELHQAAATAHLRSRRRRSSLVDQ